MRGGQAGAALEPSRRLLPKPALQTVGAVMSTDAAASRALSTPPCGCVYKIHFRPRSGRVAVPAARARKPWLGYVPENGLARHRRQRRRRCAGEAFANQSPALAPSCPGLRPLVPCASAVGRPLVIPRRRARIGERHRVSREICARRGLVRQPSRTRAAAPMGAAVASEVSALDYLQRPWIIPRTSGEEGLRGTVRIGSAPWGVKTACPKPEA